MRRERGFTAGTIRLDLIALIHHAAVMKLLQRPPDGLNVFVFKGDIGMSEINPISHFLCHLFPFTLVLPDRLPAFCVELCHAVPHDVILVLEPELFFDFDFHWEPMRIPTRFAVNLESLHGLISAHQIFQRSGHDMVDARTAVRRGRSFIKREPGFPFARSNALLENLALLPKPENLLLHGGI